MKSLDQAGPATPPVVRERLAADQQLIGKTFGDFTVVEVGLAPGTNTRTYRALCPAGVHQRFVESGQLQRLKQCKWHRADSHKGEVIAGLTVVGRSGNRLRLVCPNGHHRDIQITNRDKLTGCRECNGKSMLTYRTKDPLFVGKRIGAFEVISLGRRDMNGKPALLLRCPQGHERTAATRSLTSIGACTSCSKALSGG